MPGNHAVRRERLQAAVAALGADAALVTSLVNVRYLTGLASSNAAFLLPADGPGVLATDARYALAAVRDCPDVEPVVSGHYCGRDGGLVRLNRRDVVFEFGRGR